jgi:isoleucyl-tRNA synthetase
MLLKAYFNFRNTARFMLGNLADFDPQQDAVALEAISHPLDRYVLGTLSDTIAQIKIAYENYTFHDVYQAVNNFLSVLSSFYLDVLKDRLYTFKSSDPERRGSQTVIWTVLSAITRLMAPILSFTTEEIWSYFPQNPATRKSVFLTEFPTPNPSWKDASLQKDMEALLAIRSYTNKALEEARQEKLIGSSLDAQILVEATGDSLELLQKYRKLLPEFFIVSKVTLRQASETDFQEPCRVQVEACPDPKCPRCWNRHPEVKGEDGVCPKCQRALA